mmetsp:Transcript_29472/g.29096  ORF Transcript_29472/g.29096 Transcript_29472/m.29096 type:complete len:302 (+) Transcript_29472:20-925(+)
MDEVVQEIVKCDFGQTARDVVKVLQDYGGMTVGKITKLVQYERIDVKNVLIVLIKHGLIDFKAANEGLEVAGDQDFKVYDIKNDQIFNRLRFGRFLTMDLKIEGEATRTLEENREILLKIIEVGSLKGTPEMTDLAKSGYIVQAEYDIQLGLQAEEDDGEEKYKLEEELKAEQEAETSDLIVDPRKFYILNTRKFIHQIRNQELKTLAAAKLDSHGSDHIKDGVGKIIVGLFLDNSNYIDKSENFENTEILSLSQIKEKLKEMYDQVAEEDKASADLIKQLYVDEIKLKANLDRIQSDSLE